MDRRSFVQSALGLTAGSLFLPSLLRSAHAADFTPPKRLVVLLNQHGTYYPGWRMRWPGKGDSGTWEQDLTNVSSNEFSEGLRPLHGYRDRLMVVDGLGLVSAEADASSLRHELAYVHALTGANNILLSGIPMASAPSIDQLIANQIALPDRWRSLELGVEDVPFSMVFRDRLQQLPVETNPVRVFDRMFNSDVGESPIAPARPSLLDKVAQRYQALESRLSSSDREKLSTHRQLVRELELRVQGLQGLTCDPDFVVGNSEVYEETFDSQVQIMQAAFSCDLTRVVSINMGTVPGDMIVGAPVDVHNDYAHNIYVNGDAAAAMTTYTAVHANHMRKVLDALAAIPEAGGTMLDNTLVMWVPEVADGIHGFNRWPAVLAGGSALRMGRYLHYPLDTKYTAWTWDGTGEDHGQPHQKLLTGVCQAFGLNLNSMPVTTIQGYDGNPIDCTGTLPGMVG